MQNGIPEQFRVSDFLDWSKQQRLILNPDFQRGPVWTADFRSYFIDSILRGFPTPKIYMRSRIDIVSQQAVREIIDGQQRIRAIIDFANGQLRLNRRAGEFEKLRYANLDDDLKTAFLAYSISVEQLINASDDFVLEMFARLNTNNVPLNAAELRNAKYTGDFKFAVRNLSNKLGWFWEKYKVFTLRQRVRMTNDEFSAELFGVLLDGVKNGGKPYVDKLYARYDGGFQQADELTNQVQNIVRYIDTNLAETLRAEFFSRPPQFLILFAAIAHKLLGIPQGDLATELPERTGFEIDPELANVNLVRLSFASSSDSDGDFVIATQGATVRVASRTTRFNYVWNAISTK